MTRDTVAWNIFIRKRYVGIFAIYSPRLSHITVLWNWRKRGYPAGLFIKEILLAIAQESVSLAVYPYDVCKNHRIHIHKTFKGIVQRGKCFMGWFFGFKLCQKLFVDDIQLITKLESNVKGALMSIFDKLLLRKTSHYRNRQWQTQEYCTSGTFIAQSLWYCLSR